MTKIYIGTLDRLKERESVQLVKILEYFWSKDVKKWIVAKETGRFGYEHWQIRYTSRLDWETEIANWRMLGWEAFLEEASDTWTYERKEGEYYTSDDTVEQLQVRYGTPKLWQERIILWLEGQKDRKVYVLYDARGNHGKTWLVQHLWEKGRACYCPPTLTTVKELIAWVASCYQGEEFILIDIPRSWKWTQELYCAIETIKDGLVYDSRYKAQMRNIRGSKLLVLCNSKPKLDKLSADRWSIAGWGVKPSKVDDAQWEKKREPLP